MGDEGWCPQVLPSRKSSYKINKIDWILFVSFVKHWLQKKQARLHHTGMCSMMHDVLGLGDWSEELENETSPSETGLEYWRNYYKKMKLDLVSLVSPALPASLAACYFPDVVKENFTCTSSY